MQNLGQFLKKHSLIHKDKVAYQIKRGFRTERFTFLDVYSLARKTASFLSQQGLGKGDKVAIWAPNMPEYPILYFGCWLIGVIAVPIDVRTTSETLKIFLEKAKCKLGFKGKFIPGSFEKLAGSSFYLEDLVNLVKDLPNPSSIPQVEPKDLAEIAFTSGTTGTPKGVILTHQNFLSDVEALTKTFPLKKEYRTLSLLPLSHAFEQVVDFLSLFQEGITVTYLERTNALTILQALRKNKITSVALVPQALRMLYSGIEREVLKLGKIKQFEKAQKIAPYLPLFLRRLLFRKVHERFGRNLKFFGCGSAPLDLKLARKWEALGIEIFEGYGATETTAALTINTPFNKRLGSVGKILPGMEIKIDPKTYEILAKGPSTTTGYFEDKEKTKAAFIVYPDKGGSWYKTGDVGEFDKDGFLYLTGREAFRIILPNGQKVYPEDLERKLNAHPLVIDSCVVGVKREEGETVHAVIITREKNKLDKIISEVNQKLASHEQIMEASYWLDEDFPRTPILKIDRKIVANAVSGIGLKRSAIKIKARGKLLNLVAKVAKAPLMNIKESSILASDLKIDSLGRVELLSLIEQEFAVAISETKINQQTTVREIGELIKEAPATIEEIKINEFIYSEFLFKLRTLILADLLAFPIHAVFVPLEIHGQVNLNNLNLPAFFYFNHIGIMDGVCVLRALPNTVREKLVIAVSADLWHDYRKPWIEIFGAAFPFDNKKKIKASLALTGEFLDKGFSVLLSPEGTFSKDGKLLEFKQGIGFMAVEMQVPVVPVKIDPSYREIFPPMERKFIENLPKKRKKIWVKIGKPLHFAKGTSYKKATKTMQYVLESL